EALDGLLLCGEVGQLRADMDVEPEHVEAALERVGDQAERLLGRQAELGAVMARDDRLVRVGVDAEGDAHEYLLDTGAGGANGLVRGVEDDRCALVRRPTE